MVGTRVLQKKPFIVKHAGLHHGPLFDHEIGLFASKLEGTCEVILLNVPRELLGSVCREALAAIAKVATMGCQCEVA